MDEIKSKKKLVLIKILHTIIWAFFVFMIRYILYAGIGNKINLFTYISILSVALEGIILFIFKWKCPMTVIASRYTDNQEVGFDIYIPKIIAKHNKILFTTLYIIGVIIVIYQLLKQNGII